METLFAMFAKVAGAVVEKLAAGDREGAEQLIERFVTVTERELLADREMADAKLRARFPDQ